MKVHGIKAFKGNHCETTATGTLLRQLGIELSEPMLFGLGEALGFIFWNMKSMDFPFIGGRIKPDLLTQNLATNLNLELTVKETSSRNKAWSEVKNLIDEGNTVGLKLDCYYLEYFSKPFHFAGHYAAIYGYDDKDAFLVDTLQQGTQVKTSLQSLAFARSAKGPMASKNLYYTLKHRNGKLDLRKAVVTAIRNNANDYLNPPITNVGCKGILKTSKEIIKWFENSKNIDKDFSTVAMLMEKAGTGGALFRNLYRDFLNELFTLFDNTKLRSAHKSFTEVAAQWTEVSNLFEKASTSKDRQYILQASTVLKEIALKEKEAMEKLVSL